MSGREVATFWLDMGAPIVLLPLVDSSAVCAREGSHARQAPPRPRYPPRMSDLTIRVGDLVFTADWEADAPRTRAALTPWLPIRDRLIHCKWSGESTWIPFGDKRPDVGFENHNTHPAPGHLLIYTGDISECEILFPYGACSFSSRVGPLAGNHFATLTSGQDQLVEMGRRVLWEGAQEIEISAGT